MSLRKVAPEPIALNWLACFVCSRKIEVQDFRKMVQEGKVLQCKVCGTRHRLNASGCMGVIGVAV